MGMHPAPVKITDYAARRVNCESEHRLVVAAYLVTWRGHDGAHSEPVLVPLDHYVQHPERIVHVTPLYRIDWATS